MKPPINGETPRCFLECRSVLRLTLCTTSALIVMLLCVGTTFGQQPSTWGANLFAPSVQVGRELDAERALPIASFYKIPAAETPDKPGTLVRAEPATDFALPPGVTATRILYHTRTANNRDALASGVVLIPYGLPPKDGWPLISWAKNLSAHLRCRRTCPTQGVYRSGLRSSCLRLLKRSNGMDSRAFFGEARAERLFY